MFDVSFIIEVVFLSVALSMDSFTVSITCGLQKTMSRYRTLFLAFSFAFFQALLPLLGALLGFGLKWDVAEQVFAVLAIFVFTFAFSLLGVKMGERIRFVKPRFALVLGGIILLLLGSKTLIEHLYA